MPASSSCLRSGVRTGSDAQVVHPTDLARLQVVDRAVVLERDDRPDLESGDGRAIHGQQPYFSAPRVKQHQIGVLAPDQGS